MDVYSGFPPFPKNLEILEFCHILFQAWKMPGIAQNVRKLGNLTQNMPKLYISKFCVSRLTFQDVIYKNNSFTSFSYLHYQHTHYV